MGIIKGKKLMLFVKEIDTYKAIAFATNHTFSTSASTINVSHKDLADLATGAAKWDDQDIDTFSWSITSEHLYANEGAGYTAKDIFALYANGTVLDVKFGLADASTTGAPAGTGWVPSTSESQMLSGKAVITSYDINASVDDNASFSITLTGKGPIAIA